MGIVQQQRGKKIKGRFPVINRLFLSTELMKKNDVVKLLYSQRSQKYHRSLRQNPSCTSEFDKSRTICGKYMYLGVCQINSYCRIINIVWDLEQMVVSNASRSHKVQQLVTNTLITLQYLIFLDLQYLQTTLTT